MEGTQTPENLEHRRLELRAGAGWISPEAARWGVGAGESFTPAGAPAGRGATLWPQAVFITFGA